MPWHNPPLACRYCVTYIPGGQDFLRRLVFKG